MLAGLGQFGCVSCSRHFADEVALQTHNRGKPHKRRLKKLEEEPYTIEESLRAAGVSGTDKGEYTKRREKEAKEEEERKKQGEAVMAE